MALKTRDGTELNLKLWQKLLVIPLLLLLVFGVSTISVFFAGGGSLVGFAVGVIMLCVGTFGLLELGRVGGAPRVSTPEAIVQGAFVLVLGIVFLVVMALVR